MATAPAASDSKPALPPAATTGTGFGGGVKRFIFGLLFMGVLQVGGLAALQRQALDPQLLIYGLVGTVGVQGLLLLAWLHYTAARLGAVRQTTVSRALGATLLAVLLGVGGWWAGTYVQTLSLPASILPYAWAIPPGLAAVGYALATKLGFRTGVLRAVGATILGFGLPTAAVWAVATYRPAEAVARTEPLRALVPLGISGLNMYNLEYALRQFRLEHQDVLPGELTQLPKTDGTQLPPLDTLWPLGRVRDGMVLVNEWTTYAANKPVGSFATPERLVVAYADPKVLAGALAEWHKGPTTQPATTMPADQASRWAVLADGKVRWLSAAQFNEALEATRTALSSAANKTTAAPAPKPAPTPAERPVVVPPTGGSGGSGGSGDLKEPGLFGV